MLTVPFSIAVKKKLRKSAEITGMEDEISTVCEETLSEIFLKTTISDFFFISIILIQKANSLQILMAND